MHGTIPQTAARSIKAYGQHFSSPYQHPYKAPVEEIKMGKTTGRLLNSVIDLEDIIQSYAWKRFNQSVGVGKALFLKREKYALDIQWSFLDFDQVTSTTSTENQEVGDYSLEFGTQSRNRTRGNQKKQLDTAELSYKSIYMNVDVPVILCTEYFENETKRKKFYPYSRKEQLKSVVSVKFFQSYSLGESTNIELSNITASEKPLSIRDPVREDFEDIHRFNIDTVVAVEPRQKAEAVVSVYEKHVVSIFELTTKISMVVGCLPVVIRRKSDNEEIFTCFITSLCDVFKKHVNSNLSLVNSGNGTYAVIVTSRGTFTSKAWSDPELIVRGEPIIH